MKNVGIAILLLAGLCCAQESGGFQPASTNVWGAEYPRVDSSGRVQIRMKAPDATKVRLNFWSGPKLDMEKQTDGFWTITTPPLVPGLHYYTFIIDSAEVSDTKSAYGAEDIGRSTGREARSGEPWRAVWSSPTSGSQSRAPESCRRCSLHQRRVLRNSVIGGQALLRCLRASRCAACPVSQRREASSIRSATCRSAFAV